MGDPAEAEDRPEARQAGDPSTAGGHMAKGKHSVYRVTEVIGTSRVSMPRPASCS